MLPPEDNKKVGTFVERDREVRLLNSNEEKIASDNFVRLANVIQVLVNSTQRQIFTNLGLFSLHSEKKPEMGVATLFNGFASRLFYSGVTTYPCLQVRNILEESGAPKFIVNFSTAFLDAAIGTPLEANSMLKTFKLLGINIASKDLVTVSNRAFFPFLVRNQISWGVINNSEENDVLKKSVSAAVAGCISTPFHNIGVKVMENSLDKNWKQTCEVVINSFKSNPETLVSGMRARTISIGMASILLSSKMEEVFSEECRRFFSDTPSPSSGKAIVKSLSTVNNNNQSK